MSLHYLVGSAVNNVKYITPLVKVFKIPLTDYDLESLMTSVIRHRVAKVALFVYDMRVSMLQGWFDSVFKKKPCTV